MQLFIKPRKYSSMMETVIHNEHIRGWGLQVEQDRTCLEDMGVYDKVECLMGNGHMGPPQPLTDRQTHTIENVTFPQMHWRVQISMLYNCGSYPEIGNVHFRSTLHWWI